MKLIYMYTKDKYMDSIDRGWAGVVGCSVGFAVNFIPDDTMQI